MPVSVSVRKAARAVGPLPSPAALRRRVGKMLAALQMPNAIVSILITDDREIRDLNRDYRGIDRPTDVLSFSLREGEGARAAGDELGDVVLSATTTRRQARAARRPFLDETTMLLAHGLLHLLGWDHRTAREDARMRKETDRLCVAAGAPPLFFQGGVDRTGRSVPTPPRSRR